MSYVHVTSLFIYRFSCFFFFKQKTAYELRISDWSSDVCSSDLPVPPPLATPARRCKAPGPGTAFQGDRVASCLAASRSEERRVGKSVSVRVDLGGRRIIKKKKKNRTIKSQLYNANKN